MKFFSFFFFFLISIFISSKEKLPLNPFFELREKISSDYAYKIAKNTLDLKSINKTTYFNALDYLTVYHLNKNEVDIAVVFLNKLKPNTPDQEYIYYCRKAYYYYRINLYFDQFNSYIK